MAKYFGYIRVSTAKQGTQGVSLQEQREAIANYAERGGLEVAAWFEERVTAAKRGRPMFGQMLKQLRRGQARGVIIHKIDRSARNLRDWADLGELIDAGIEVHFANESLDLHSRGGRLSADIQAVVAADFIRNLREETRKGFYGRIKQGILPLPAPIGYRDCGKAKPKEMDPVQGPLVRQAFELYSSGSYTLDSLMTEMHRRGLRNKRGGRVTRNGMSTLLNNPFYLGLIRIKRTGETFPGVHPPLIHKSLFDRVQALLRGRVCTRVGRHQFLFRRLIACRHCGYSLIGERQKGHVYYRCQTKTCPTTGIREEAAEAEVFRVLGLLAFDDWEQAYLRGKLAQLRVEWVETQQTEVKSLELRQDQVRQRLNRLTDAFLDQNIEQEIYAERKEALLHERLGLEEKLATLKTETRQIPDRLAEFLELAGRAGLSYETGLPEEKRELLKIVTSNRWLDQKNVEIALSVPFQVVAQRHQTACGAPKRDRPRTLDQMLRQITKWLATNNPAPKMETEAI